MPFEYARTEIERANCGQKWPGRGGGGGGGDSLHGEIVRDYLEVLDR